MLVQDQNGNWYDDAGGTGSQTYSTQDGAANAAGGGAGGVGGGAMTGLAGGLLMIFIFGPVIAAKLVGLIWGLLLKLGIVGKVITSLLMIIAGPFIMTLAIMFSQPILKSFTGSSIATQSFIAAVVLISPVWYYFWHYDVVKAMGARVFSAKIMNFAKFLWFGALGSILIGFFKGQAVQPVIALGTTIAGFVYYFKSVRPYAQDVERTASFKFRWIGMAVAAGLSVLLTLGFVWAKADTAMKNAKEKAQFAAAVADIGGKELTVETSTLNLRAEPSATGRVVRTLNKDNTVKATGKLSGLWIPVESGSDRGYVFALSLRLDDSLLSKTLLPFEATTTEPIQLYNELHYQNQDQDQPAHELPQGSGLMVATFESLGIRNANYFIVIVKNREYRMFAEDAETLVPQLNADGGVATLSKDTPPQFDRKTPFQATVTEAITAIVSDGSGTNASIPEGATVTVTGPFTKNGISGAFVNYNNRENINVYWNYLKLAE
jgi:hypothetical protein